MYSQYSYHDIVHADTPDEVTRAAFWRTRGEHPARISWGMFARRADLVADPPPVEVNDIPWEIRRYLPHDNGRLHGFNRKMLWHWRAPVGGGGAEEWQTNRMIFLRHIPREIFLDLVKFIESPVAIHSPRGRDSTVDMHATDGSGAVELGRDRHGMIDIRESLELYLRRLLELDETAEANCYLTGTAGGWAAAHSNRGNAREKMHRRIREAIDDE